MVAVDNEGARKGDEVHTCQACGGTTYETTVDSALWGTRGLVLVEDIPARVCEKCGEQHFDEKTSAKLTELTARGFPPNRAVREIVVPVFSLDSVDLPNEEELRHMDRYEAIRREEARRYED